MDTTRERDQRTASPAEGPPQVVRVSVPKHSIGSELRAIRIVWRRDLIRFINDRIRIAASLVQPLLFLFVMGSGLQRISSAGTHGVNLKTFIYPGILCIAVMFTAMFSAASIVWDREFGFLREMMVAPMLFRSGALSPVSGLPGWLAVLNRIAPLTYAVDPMRRLVFAHLTISPAARHALDPGVTWWSWHVPALLEAGVVVLLGMLM